MHRRDFIIALGGLLATSAAWPFAASAAQKSGGVYLAAMQKLKREFDKMSKPSEAARVDYVTRLLLLREKAARTTEEWKAIDTEIFRHPAPASDEKGLADRLIGEWASPRHEYRYKRDGTWTMLPEDKDTTHGKWRIEGNQYITTNSLDTDTDRYTVIMITKKYFVMGDEEAVFYETRLK